MRKQLKNNMLIALTIWLLAKIQSLIISFFGLCIMSGPFSYEYEQTSGCIEKSNLLQIATFIVGIILINFLSIKHSKTLTEYLKLSSPQIFLIAFLILELVNFIK